MSIKCWTCGGNSKTRIVKVRDGSEQVINVCLNCGFEFFNFDNMDAIDGNLFEELRLGSSGLKIPEIDEDFQNGYNQCQDYISKYIDINSKPNRVLEIGCSWGYFLARLKELDIESIGIEKNPVRSTYVEKYLKIRCLSDLSKIKDNNLIFDRIFMFFTLEYISKPLDYINRLLELLSHNGQIIIYTPNLSDALKDLWKSKSFNNFFYEKQAVGYYTLESLKKLMNRVSNYKISYTLETYQGYSFFNHFAWYLNNKPISSDIVGSDKIQKKIISILSGDSDVEKDLRKLIIEFDNNYKKVLEKKDLGNNIILKINKSKY